MKFLISMAFVFLSTPSLAKVVFEVVADTGGALHDLVESPASLKTTTAQGALVLTVVDLEIVLSKLALESVDLRPGELMLLLNSALKMPTHTLKLTIKEVKVDDIDQKVRVTNMVVSSETSSI